MGNALAFDENLLIEEIKKLPTEKVTEVFDFVEFLRDRKGDVRETTKLSEPAFKQIWDNKKNAAYDKMWDDSVATDLLKGYSEKDVAYDKL